MAMRSRTCAAVPALAVLVAGILVVAQSPAQAESSAEVRDRAEQPVRNGSASQARNGDIYGYQLMTERERSQYRERVQRSGGGEELDRIRNEHEEQMQARARERGVTLSGPRITGGSGMAANAGDDGGSGQ